MNLNSIKKLFKHFQWKGKITRILKKKKKIQYIIY